MFSEIKNEIGCGICEILVQAVDDFITNPENENAVGEGLTQICDLIFVNDVVTGGKFANL